MKNYREDYSERLEKSQRRKKYYEKLQQLNQYNNYIKEERQLTNRIMAQIKKLKNKESEKDNLAESRVSNSFLPQISKKSRNQNHFKTQQSEEDDKDNDYLRHCSYLIKNLKKMRNSRINSSGHESEDRSLSKSNDSKNPQQQVKVKLNANRRITIDQSKNINHDSRVSYRKEQYAGSKKDKRRSPITKEQPNSKLTNPDKNEKYNQELKKCLDELNLYLNKQADKNLAESRVSRSNSRAISKADNKNQVPQQRKLKQKVLDQLRSINSKGQDLSNVVQALSDVRKDSARNQNDRQSINQDSDEEKDEQIRRDQEIIRQLKKTVEDQHGRNKMLNKCLNELIDYLKNPVEEVVKDKGKKNVSKSKPIDPQQQKGKQQAFKQAFLRKLKRARVKGNTMKQKFQSALQQKKEQQGQAT